ncbi:hypothetical protein DFA_05553 [Cavenderia fasciculata]|uniref:SET domain-containing protein n=1 Tax=Cavenderia fasciculata TaxID=261658 RepID=F4PLJ9_CACFS|nr:uncharacterized protein DFA_05553 [Cavenderia fasciculata]EGG23421.1 hypothetical protein DFA_05553 [Cavenderia fasciculata]|eukprot:XP_004361272.1 hypothetical protein DFA_05553 [Cavenderia fasciculata]
MSLRPDKYSGVLNVIIRSSDRLVDRIFYFCSMANKSFADDFGGEGGNVKPATLIKPPTKPNPKPKNSTSFCTYYSTPRSPCMALTFNHASIYIIQSKKTIHGIMEQQHNYRKEREMVIPEFFKGKNLLITGTTGFVGKVLLEKLVRDIPDIGFIYIVIRGANAKERFEDDIMTSRIWDVLRERMGQEAADRHIREHVIPLSGDLSKDNLALSPEDYRMVIERCNIILHCAASIDFRERLDKAIESNLYGSLRMLELAKQLKNLVAMVHCSTAYVNSNREGWLDEELPVLDFNPEEMVELIMKQDVQTIEKITPNLLGAYPNTYTFTKAITERILALRRGDVPLCFVRPTIVGGSLKEPVPGWVDSVAAVGAVMLYCGVGLVKFMKGEGRMVADIVPVDYVANAMISVVPSIANQNVLQIYQIGTSHRNPVSWNSAAHWVSEYWRNHTPKKAIARSSFSFHNNVMYEAHFFMKYGIPSFLLQMMAFFTGKEDTKNKAESFKKVVKAARLITDTFQHFTAHEWVFSVSTLEKVFVDVLNADDRQRFNCDAANINWQSYLCYFCYGLHKFVLKEEGVRPPTELLNTSLITKSDLNATSGGVLQWIFADVSWAYTSFRHVTQTPLPPRAPAEIRSLVMNSPRVQMAMEKVSREEGVLVSEIERRASQVMDRMQSNLNVMVVRVLGWFLKKVWRKIYQGIHVDEKGIEAIRAAIQKAPVVLIPTHRSYIDFLIISYIFFEYNLPMPHIAAGEDFLGIILVNWFLRNAGAFFLRRSFHGDPLYWAIFSEYVQRLVIDNQPVEFFIEGKRSRTGKSLHPKLGLLAMVANPYFEGRVQDVQVAPIGISYEKVLEGELYSNEMMGENKTKESLNGLFRATKILQMNWGRINVVFAPPISMKAYAEDMTASVSASRRLNPPPTVPAPSAHANPATASPAPTTPANISEGDFEQISSTHGNTRAPGSIFDPYNNTDDRRMLIQDLGYRIVNDLNKSAIITTTATVATILLTFRRGISREELISRVEWLRDEILLRGGDVAFEGPSDALVDHSLKLLSNLISKRRNMYEPAGSQQNNNNNYKRNILVLSFYRNQLLHHFLWDGLISCALLSAINRQKPTSSSSSYNSNLKIKESELIGDVKFLFEIMSVEFVNKPGTDSEHNILEHINRMVQRGYLAKSAQGEYSINSSGESAVTFFANLFCPIVEGYMVAMLTLFSIQPDISVKKNVFLQRVGWFSEKMYEEGSLNYYESCSMEMLANSVHLFTQLKIITKKKHTEVVGKRTTRQSTKKEKKPTRRQQQQEAEEYIQLLAPYKEKDGKLRELAEKLSSYLEDIDTDINQMGKKQQQTKPTTTTTTTNNTTNTTINSPQVDYWKSKLLVDFNHNVDEEITVAVAVADKEKDLIESTTTTTTTTDNNEIVLTTTTINSSAKLIKELYTNYLDRCKEDKEDTVYFSQNYCEIAKGIFSETLTTLTELILERDLGGVQYQLQSELKRNADFFTDLTSTIKKKDRNGRILVNVQQQCQINKLSLLFAVATNDIKIVDLMLKNGATAIINVGDTVTKITPLHMSFIMGNTAIAKLLLENGANYDLMDGFRARPLDYARLRKMTSMSIPPRPQTVSIYNYKNSATVESWTLDRFERELSIHYDASITASLEYLIELCFSSFQINADQTFRDKYLKMIERSGGEENVIVGWISDQVGWGLYANKDFQKGEYIVRYGGRINSAENMVTHCYNMMSSMDGFGLDAYRHRSMGGMINHSAKHKNAESECIFEYGAEQAIITATKFIGRGQQIFIDYSNSYWNPDQDDNDDDNGNNLKE